MSLLLNPLTSEEKDLLLSLPDYELEDWINQFPPSQQAEILTEIGSHEPTIQTAGTMQPTDRQREFLELECEEALYGGAAGGAKTIGLFLYLAQGVHLRDYTGYFFRRTWAECHGGNDSPLAKSFRVFRPMGASWNGNDKTWTFPSGAKIVFGHLEDANAHLRYQGPSMHRAAFDELTHFLEEQYTWMIAYRMRREVGYPLACGVRASCNPGGSGHDWVKHRFITDEALGAMKALDPMAPCPRGLKFWPAVNRAFVPARLADNPHLDIVDYRDRMLLQGSNAVTLARMMNGDWAIREDGIIKSDWLRYFTVRGEILVALDPNGNQLGAFDCRECQRFATIDTAGTSEEKAKQKKGKPPSWSVCQIWDFWPKPKWLFLRHVWRARCDWEGLKLGAKRTIDVWKPRKVLIENAHYGPPLASECKGYPCELVPTEGKGKVERSTELQNMLSAAQVFLPRADSVLGASAWLSNLESEWLSWTGGDEETADQIDTASMAANHVKRSGGGWGGTIPQVGQRPSW